MPGINVIDYKSFDINTDSNSLELDQTNEGTDHLYSTQWSPVYENCSGPMVQHYCHGATIFTHPIAVRTLFNLYGFSIEILALSKIIKATMGVGYFVTDPP